MKVRLTSALRVPQRRIAWWLAGGTTLVIAATAGGVLVATAGDNPKPAASTTRVQRGTVTTTVSSAGTAQPLQSRALSFSLSGTVTELNVKAGDSVAAGTTLAKIDDTDARSAVTDAQAKVSNAQDAVDRATASLSGSSSTGNSSSACVANAAYERLASPSPSGSGSASPSATRSAPAPATSSTSPGGGGAPGGRPTGSGSCPSAGGSAGGSSGGRNSGGGGSTTDSLLSAQQQFNNAKRTLEQKQAQLAGTVITAPVAGKILSVGGVIGTRATQSASGFIVLAGTNDVAVKAQFTEAEVAKVSVGQVAKITLPNLAGQEFTGTVLQIDPAGTISSRLVRYAAVIAFDTMPQTVLYGQTANVAVITASAVDVLYVPSTAISRTDGTVPTVVVRVKGKDERRSVGAGLRGDAYTEIQSGLTAGEEVLTVGR